jgi:hypothetical protein
MTNDAKALVEAYGAAEYSTGRGFVDAYDMHRRDCHKRELLTRIAELKQAEAERDVYRAAVKELVDASKRTGAGYINAGIPAWVPYGSTHPDIPIPATAAALELLGTVKESLTVEEGEG